MAMAKEEPRKGPWTEQEDMQLVCYVGLFGERRWDFIARVSGLNRTGKSCRLRWVNYLHPGLKHGRLTPQEESLVLELHACWGNRWSRIARKLPGRTDNEIKNYWRTHMRKKAQETKKNAFPLSISSSANNGWPMEVNGERQGLSGDNEEVLKGYSMDQIWNEISLSKYTDEAWYIPCPPMSSLMWEHCPDTMWKIDAEGPRMLPTTGCSSLISNYQFGGEPYH